MSDKPVVVIDATVMIKWYLPEIYSEDCLRLLQAPVRLKTSEIAISQIASSLWKRARTGEVKVTQARRIISNLTKLPVEFVPTAPWAAYAMELSVISSRTFNEALYFVLALGEKSPLVTADHRWHSLLSTGRLKRHIELVEDALKKIEGLTKKETL